MRRWDRTNEGKPLPRFPKAGELRRFFSSIEEREGHWIWTGRTDKNGYGLFCFQRVWMGAHRFSVQVFKGLLPIGHQAHHDREACGINNCVHPYHLEGITHAENVSEANRSRKKPQPKELTDDLPF